MLFKVYKTRESSISIQLFSTVAITTKIAHQKWTKGRVNVYLDDKYYFSNQNRPAR